MTSAVITPTLMMGPPEDMIYHDGLVAVASAAEAVRVIEMGGLALLPPGSWAMAADVLKQLGCDDAWIAGRLKLAGHGSH